jgi:SAM-dependent methyltransferase
MPQRDPETERIRSIYDRRSAKTPAPSVGPDLRWVCSQAEGDTLEIGIGQGRTLACYPPDVRLSAIELSPMALASVVATARRIGMRADLREGDATALPYPGEHFDTVVFAFSLCTIPDDRRAMAEAVRVLRSGGRLALVEHVRSPRLLVRGVERALEPLALRRMGDHLMREPLDLVVAEELEVEFLQRRLLGVVERLIARKPFDNQLAEAV